MTPTSTVDGATFELWNLIAILMVTHRRISPVGPTGVRHCSFSLHSKKVIWFLNICDLLQFQSRP